ncbi:hypothetical protein [Rhodopseudomonas pseudopalustris]|uniref:Lipoprotein n=2 Tax=Rhodopseudomonas TaxID=1073 RepID=Q130I9_RHOPS|nr:hypothetical protein [Rhodopseudomonas pseudopalustris]ABE41500.1 conserved hypothetical protein [Rhodopseudomonas palustris BisB5]SEO07830.1 hypothetical protein SAMN05444123_101194 [Rhodopseudomonas pseudopalustris]
MSFRMSRIAGMAAAVLLATTMIAGAQSQTDTRGNAMGSERVGNGRAMERGTVAPAPGMTTGSSGRMNGANHPTPQSTQGDVGPEGNNNGTQTGTYRR